MHFAFKNLNEPTETGDAPKVVRANADYQMRTRLSGARYIASVDFTSNAA